MKEKTLVFKVGTSSLTQKNGSLDRIKIARITNQLAQLHQEGHQIVLVTSGSIAAGFRRLGFEKRPTKIAEKQASAAVGQGLLIEEYTQNLMKDGIVSAQVLLTQDDFADARRYQNASQALQVLLRQARKGADEDRQQGDQHQHLAPLRRRPLEAFRKDASEQHHGRQLRRPGEEGHDRGRRALVDVGRPHVERGGRDLEG